MRRNESFVTDVGGVTVSLVNFYDDFYHECYLITVDVNHGDCPYERIIKETEEEAVNVFKCLCEKYRPKRDGNNKDGQVIKYLRELGFKAKPTIDSYSGIRRGIAVIFITKMGTERVKTFSPNEMIEKPEIIAEMIKDYLVTDHYADVEKGRERYGLK